MPHNKVVAADVLPDWLFSLPWVGSSFVISNPFSGTVISFGSLACLSSRIEKGPTAPSLKGCWRNWPNCEELGAVGPSLRQHSSVTFASICYGVESWLSTVFFSWASFFAAW